MIRTTMKSSSNDSNWIQEVRARVRASARAAETMDFEALLATLDEEAVAPVAK